MFKSIKINRSLLKGSIILLIAFNIFNVLNFVFQASMSWLLPVEEYSILTSLFFFIYLSGIFSDSIQTTITKYSAGEHSAGKLKSLAKKFLRKSFFISSILFIFYIIISVPLSFVLHIPFLLMLINGLMILAAFLIPITRGIMQGTKRFGLLGFNLIIEGSIKLAFAIILVLLGLKVYGAVIGTVLGFVIAFIFSFAMLKDIFVSKEEDYKTSGIFSYTAPVLVIMFVITFFYSIDLFIARIVFPASEAGFYAIASMLAKTIFLGTQPISRAMFSFSSEEKEEGNKRKHLNHSLVLLFLLLFAALLAFYLFPNLLVHIFSGKQAPQSVSVLFILGLANAVIAIANLFLFHKLSGSRIKNYLLFLVFPVIELALLFVFSSSLMAFSIAFLISSIIFLLGSILLIKITK